MNMDCSLLLLCFFSETHLRRARRRRGRGEGGPGVQRSLRWRPKAGLQVDQGRKSEEKGEKSSTMINETIFL
jgi:hypothetical protein